MVYYDAIALVDELAPPPDVLQHLIDRARSPDPVSGSKRSWRAGG